MLDVKFVIQNIKTVEEALQKRGSAMEPLIPIRELAQRRNELQQEFDRLRNEQNQASQEIQRLKKEKHDAAPTIAAMKQVADRIKQINPELEVLEDQIKNLLYQIPNIPHASVPVGKSAEDNTVARNWGEKPKLNFPVKSHWELGESPGILDFERGAKITGARFTLYRN